MKKLNVICVACVVLLPLVLGSCNVVRNIPGNVAGQLMNEGGQGQGFIAVKLYNVETGQVELVETADDKGNYMFKGVEAGNYVIKTAPIGGGELANDCEEFYLSPGKTKTLNIIIYRDRPVTPD